MSKSARTSIVVLSAAFSMPVVGAPPHMPAFDEYGIEKDPLCSYALPETLKAMHKQEPSTERAQTPDWKIEIYVNPYRTSWTLVGIRSIPDWDEDEMCHLANGRGDYTSQKWYRAFFKSLK